MEAMTRVTHLYCNYPAYQPPTANAGLVKDMIDGSASNRQATKFKSAFQRFVPGSASPGALPFFV